LAAIRATGKGLEFQVSYFLSHPPAGCASGAPGPRQQFARLTRGVGVAVLASLVAGCVPNMGPKPTLSEPAAYDTARTFTDTTGTWPTDQWWKAYGDPQLDALIDEAIAGSPDLRITEARLKQAQAIAQQAGGELWPSLSAEGSLMTRRQSLNQGYPPAFQAFLPRGWHTGGRIAGALSYELDLFGRNRAAFAAAKSEARAAEIEVTAARLALATSVASAYADLIRLNADRTAAADAVRVRKDTAALISARAKQQLEHQGGVSQADAEAAATQADMDAIERQIEVTRHQLAALLGKGPDRGLDVTVPKATAIKPLGLPPSLTLDLMGRRPDIIAARLRAEAAAKRIDVAKANFYPNISLTGLIGLEALDLGDVAKHSSLMGAAGPAASLPIFDGGKLRAGYRLSRAEYDEAVAVYDWTVANALREVADAVTNQRALDAQLTNARAALTAAENSYRIAGLRYRGGLSRFLDVLTAEDKTLILRRNVADLEAQAFAQHVALVRALGGGFSAQDPT